MPFWVFFVIFSKSFYCVTMKLGLVANQRYFQVSVKLWFTRIDIKTFSKFIGTSWYYCILSIDILWIPWPCLPVLTVWPWEYTYGDVAHSHFIGMMFEIMIKSSVGIFTSACLMLLAQTKEWSSSLHVCISCYMEIEIWVNIGSGNGLVFDNTTPLPDYH